jgi:V-type H+-transporting ATPase subunit a
MSLLEVFKIFLHKEKALYTSLNKFKKEDRIYLGFAWVATADYENM